MRPLVLFFNMPSKVTYYALAKAAGVSPATVSRIVAGKTKINPETLKRVESEAARLGLDLTKKRHEGRTIAFILSNRDVLHQFHARVLAGAEKFATEHKWQLVFLTLHYQENVTDAEIPLPEILGRNSLVRGVILAGANSPNLLSALRKRRMPFSILGNNVTGDWDSKACDVVYSDDIQGAHDATRYLIHGGHRNIWFLGDTRLPWFRRCGEGYQRAMHEAGLEPRLSRIHSDGRELGYLATKFILAEGSDVTAILAGADTVAAGACSALREAGRSIPRDVSVMGFNDSEAALFYPALTTVREFPEELGRHLTAFVVNRIQNPELPPQSLTIPTQLVERQSTLNLTGERGSTSGNGTSFTAGIRGSS